MLMGAARTVLLGCLMVGAACATTNNSSFDRRALQSDSCADLNGDGEVSVTDLLTLLGQFGGDGSADLDGDGVVSVTDLLALLGQFGSECASDEPTEPINLAAGQPSSQSSEGWDGSPGRAVDGNVNGAYGGGSCTHTNAAPSWWQVDLGATNTITAVDVTHRTDCCQDRLVSADIFVSATDDYSAGTACGMLSDPSSNPERSSCPNAEGQFVTVHLEAGTSGGQHMTLCEVEVYACGGDGQPVCEPVPPTPPPNLARSQPATQSSEGWDGAPGRAVDGNTNGQYGGGSCTHTNGAGSWWQVDLGDAAPIGAVAITHRADCCQDRLVGAQIWVSDTSDYSSSGELCGALSDPSSNPETSECGNAAGQFVTVSMDGPHMTLCEVEVYACDDC